MSGLTAVLCALLAVMTYFLAGAIGLACTMLSGCVPRPMRDADGFGDAFRNGLKATATWPWTWKRWTGG
jgi:hypothetical protein